MDWDKLRLFRAVADAGSFTGASSRLNLSQPAISRQIRSLEEGLGTALFFRHARGLVLTQEGSALLQTVKEVTTKLDATERSIRDQGDMPSGRLKVTTAMAIGVYWLVPMLAEFFQIYPKVRINLVLDDDELNLSEGEADVAIRFRPAQNADLVQRPLLRVNHHVYGSMEYLSRVGVPETVEDLDQHQIITYGPDVPLPIRDVNWLAAVGRSGEARQAQLSINNIYGVYRAVRNGIGLAAIPDYLITETDGLQRVLTGLEVPSFDTYFVYPEELRGLPRLVAFRDFLFDKAKSSTL